MDSSPHNHKSARNRGIVPHWRYAHPVENDVISAERMLAELVRQPQRLSLRFQSLIQSLTQSLTQDFTAVTPAPEMHLRTAQLMVDIDKLLLDAENHGWIKNIELAPLPLNGTLKNAALGLRNDAETPLFRQFQYKSASIVAYQELQSSLPASLLDEDVLYKGFDDFVAGVTVNKQFLVIGDTSHTDSALRSWLYFQLSEMQSLKEAGYKHLCIEVDAGVDKDVQAFQDGKIDQNTLFSAIKKKLGKDATTQGVKNTIKSIQKANSYGLRVHCVDTERTTNLGKRLTSGDESTAHYIRRCTNGEKAVVVFGANHFTYRFGMLDHLGHDKCATVFVHTTLDSYKAPLRRNAYDYVPRYVYVIDQDAVIQPADRYGRDGGWKYDTVRCAIYKEKQAQESQKFWEMALAAGHSPHRIQAKLNSAFWTKAEVGITTRTFTGLIYNRSEQREKTFPLPQYRKA